MKIEKLTENKIRIILKEDDFKDKNFDLQNLMLKSNEDKNLFLEILERAKKDFDFDTDGYKLLIETFKEDGDYFIFTITKYLEPSYRPKKVTVSDKNTRYEYNKANTYFLITKFNCLDDLCSFCNFIKANNSIDLNKSILNSKIYIYNSSYYLIINVKNLSTSLYTFLQNSLGEFGKMIPFYDTFEAKLLEYGKLLFKKNAINECIKYFV